MKSDLSDRVAKPRETRGRRLWSADDKARMVAESHAPGVSVATVAQRYGVNANLLFTWRRQRASIADRSATAVELLPVTVVNDRAAASDGATSEPVGRMEIALVGGERIVVGADVDAAALARVVKALSRR